MAWTFACYVEHLARRGAADRRMPMYANPWLGPQPGQVTAGQYPSGGPAAPVLDVWRAAAPSLALPRPGHLRGRRGSGDRAYATGATRSSCPSAELRAGELRAGARHTRSDRLVGVRNRRRANPDGQLSATLRPSPRSRTRSSRHSAQTDASPLSSSKPGVEVETRSFDGHRHHGARGTRAVPADAARCRRAAPPATAGGARRDRPDAQMAAPATRAHSPRDRGHDDGRLPRHRRELTLDFFAADATHRDRFRRRSCFARAAGRPGRASSTAMSDCVLPIDQVGAVRIRVVRLRRVR